jgi:hypothetical protein
MSRTDRRAFRRLCLDDPVVVELREWSLRLADDVAAHWFLALWECVPTPAKAAEARGAAIARILNAHRIRRFKRKLPSFLS